MKVGMPRHPATRRRGRAALSRQGAGSEKKARGDCASRLHLRSVVTVVSVDAGPVGAVVSRNGVLRILRRIFKRILVQGYDIASLFRRVFQYFPGHRITIRSHSEESAKLQHRIADLARSEE